MQSFYLKQKAIAFRGSYKILDEEQNVLYECKASVFRIPTRVEIFDVKRQEIVYMLDRKLFTFLPKHYLKTPSGEIVATMSQRFAIGRRRVSIDSIHGQFEVQGNFWAHDFGIFSEKGEIASIRKKLISWGDTYQITIHTNEHVDFFLALVVMIDRKFHTNKSSRRGSHR